MKRIRRSDGARQEKLDKKLYRAASSGQTEELKSCIAEGGKIVSQGPLGTALHAAAARGHLSAVLLLLESGAPTNVLQNSNYAPLHLAARYGHSPVVAALITFGANLDISSKFEKRTPLHCAVKWMGLDVVDLLLEKGASVDCTDLYGNTPLHLSCQMGSPELTERLLSHKADVMKYDNDGWSAMHFAASEGYIHIIKLLVQYAAPFDQQNKHGRTPLHWACMKNHITTVETLLALGVNSKIKDCIEKQAVDLTTNKSVRDIIAVYESNLPEDGSDSKVTPMDVQLSLKPFVRHISRIESIRSSVQDDEDKESVDSDDSTSLAPQMSNYISEMFGPEIKTSIDKCFGASSNQLGRDNKHTKTKYKQLLVSVGALLTQTSTHVDTMYTTISAALQNKTDTGDVLKTLFTKLQSIEDNLADFQSEISGRVRTLTLGLTDIMKASQQNRPTPASAELNRRSKKTVFEQGHFLGKVAHSLAKYKDSWRPLVPILNVDLTDGSINELVEKIGARSQNELDRASTLLFTWQLWRHEEGLDTKALIEAVKTLQNDELQSEVENLVEEYFNFTPLLHPTHSSTDKPMFSSDARHDSQRKKGRVSIDLGTIPEATDSETTDC